MSKSLKIQIPGNVINNLIKEAGATTRQFLKGEVSMFKAGSRNGTRLVEGLGAAALEVVRIGAKVEKARVQLTQTRERMAEVAAERRLDLVLQDQAETIQHLKKEIHFLQDRLKARSEDAFRQGVLDRVQAVKGTPPINGTAWGSEDLERE